MKKSIDNAAVRTGEFGMQGEGVAIFHFSQKSNYNVLQPGNNKIKESSLMACGGGGGGGGCSGR